MTFKKLFVLILILGSANTLFSQSQDFFFWYWDLGTAAVIYEDDTVNAENKIVYAEKTGRFILTGDIGLGISLDKRVRLLTGGIILADLAANSSVHANHLDYGFFTGVQVYPQLAGFNFGVDYVLGSRTDFIKLPGETASQVTSTQWGNGFRLNAGYDFSYHGSRFAPSVEGSYRRMPRGGSADHYFSIFLKFNIFP